MNQQTLIEKPTTEVATTQPDFLTLAIERGVDADALEKLVALHERLEARKAEQAFNEALQQFQERVPVISKNANGHHSKYARLEHITETIKPLMRELGLSYSFSTRSDGSYDALIVTCTIHHVQGHSRSSEFPIVVDKTAKAMNSCQQMASATTYAKRYALIQALGITTADTDDDAYAAGQSQRREMAGEPTQDDVKEIKRQWVVQFRKQQLKPVEASAEFHQWVADISGLSVVDAASFENWTTPTLNACLRAIEKQRNESMLDA